MHAQMSSENNENSRRVDPKYGLLKKVISRGQRSYFDSADWAMNGQIAGRPATTDTSLPQRVHSQDHLRVDIA